MATLAVIVADLRAHDGMNAHGFPAHRRVDGDLAYQFTRTDGIAVLSVRERVGARGLPAVEAPRVATILAELGCPSTSLAYMGQSKAGVHYWAWQEDRVTGAIQLLGEESAASFRTAIRRVLVVGQRPTAVGAA